MENLKVIVSSAIAALTFGLIASTPVAAKTPDGITPNNEMVCDGLKADGTTKGLYGLCVAYCAATDSPEDLTTEEKIASLPKPSARLLANYNKKRAAAGNVDPQMPCATYYDESACPAWTQAEINSVGTHVTSASNVYQIREDDREYDGGYYKYLYDHELLSSDNRYVQNYVQVYKYYGTQVGYFGDFEYDYTTGTWVRNIYNQVSLDDAQYAACEAEIRAHVMPTQTP